MNLQDLPRLTEEWLPGFLSRFPGRLNESMPPLAMVWLTRFLCRLEIEKPQRFTTAPDDQPLFAAQELSEALGVERSFLAGLLIRCRLAFHRDYVHYLRDAGGAELEPWISFDGLVLAVDSLQAHQVADEEKLECLAQLQGVLRFGLLEAAGVSSSDSEQVAAMLVPIHPATDGE